MSDDIALMTLEQAEEILDENLIVTHHDADGITAAVLLVEATNTDPNRVKFADKFGSYITPEDIMLDMRPIEGFRGICYDHHPDHPEDRKYTLIWDDVPTSLIVFNKFRDSIPREHWWKVVVGVTGDGQANKIPTYIWKLFPELLIVSENKYWGGSYYKTWQSPAYSRLSALINAAARSRKADLSFRKLLAADKVDDIITDPELEMLRRQLADKVKKIANQEARVFSIGPFRLILYQAEENLGGRIAMKFSDDDMTIIAVNEATGEVSIRGDLTTLLVEELNKLGIGTFGGHAGYAGGELIEPFSPSILISLMNSIFSDRDVDIE